MAELPNVIELRLDNPGQIFNTLDPSPFHERDLDDDAVSYIVGWARETRKMRIERIVINLPEAQLDTLDARILPTAIRNYFAFRASQLKQDLSELMRIGRWSLGVGMLVLFACLLVTGYLKSQGQQGPIVDMIEQSLLILGWVANWRPLEIFLYEWWPLRRNLRLFVNLSEVAVDVHVARPLA